MFSVRRHRKFYQEENPKTFVTVGQRTGRKCQYKQNANKGSYRQVEIQRMNSCTSEYKLKHCQIQES